MVQQAGHKGSPQTRLYKMSQDLRKLEEYLFLSPQTEKIQELHKKVRICHSESIKLLNDLHELNEGKNKEPASTIWEKITEWLEKIKDFILKLTPWYKSNKNDLPQHTRETIGKAVEDLENGVKGLTKDLSEAMRQAEQAVKNSMPKPKVVQQSQANAPEQQQKNVPPSSPSSPTLYSKGPQLSKIKRPSVPPPPPPLQQQQSSSKFDSNKWLDEKLTELKNQETQEEKSPQQQTIQSQVDLGMNKLPEINQEQSSQLQNIRDEAIRKSLTKAGIPVPPTMDERNKFMQEVNKDNKAKLDEALKQQGKTASQQGMPPPPPPPPPSSPQGLNTSQAQQNILEAIKDGVQLRKTEQSPKELTERDALMANIVSGVPLKKTGIDTTKDIESNRKENTAGIAGAILNSELLKKYSDQEQNQGSRLSEIEEHEWDDDSQKQQATSQSKQQQFISQKPSVPPKPSGLTEAILDPQVQEVKQKLQQQQAPGLQNDLKNVLLNRRAAIEGKSKKGESRNT